LLAWKRSIRRKPLLLQGARQTGKTFILRAFGRNEYRNVLYCNFEERPDFAQFFQRDLNPRRILAELSLYLDLEVRPGVDLIIFDEIQTGMGRTGRGFAYQHTDIRPDVMTLAKALGNGVPIGACLARGAAADVFKPGNHGSTFGGNPLSTSAALAVLHSIQEDNLVSRAEQLGTRMLDGFKAQLGNIEGVVSVRGRGLMLGIELGRPCGELMQRALDRKLLINVTADTVVRLLPPLILTDAQADEIVVDVSQLVVEFLGSDS